MLFLDFEPAAQSPHLLTCMVRRTDQRCAFHPLETQTERVFFEFLKLVGVVIADDGIMLPAGLQVLPNGHSKYADRELIL